MDKSAPDPPPDTFSNEAFTADLFKDHSALHRAIDFHLTGQQHTARDELRDVSFEDIQLYVADLLCSASVTAYHCGDRLKGADRAMLFSMCRLPNR